MIISKGYILLFAMFVCRLSFAVTVSDLSRHSEFYNAKISPDGKYLAVLMNDEGKKSLAFMRLSDFEVTYVQKASDDTQAGSYYWVNDERVVIEVEQILGSQAQPTSAGELYAVNYDGSRGEMIFGYRSESGSLLRAYGGEIISVLPDDEKHILVSKTELTRGEQKSNVTRLNVYTGREKIIKVSPIGYNRFLVDKEGVPRIVVGIDDEHNSKIFFSDKRGDGWELLDTLGNRQFVPISFGADTTKLYALESESGEPAKLIQYDIKAKTSEVLFSSDIAEPSYLLESSSDVIYGIRIDEDYPQYQFIRDDLIEAQVHKSLLNAFGGDVVGITSKTKDSKKMVLHVSGDKNPGQFYLFDTETMKAKLLFSAADWLNPADFVSTEAFRIRTSDGYQLTGYLTLPDTKSSENLPLIVIPHGGPHARDYWGFDPTAQLLAKEGYAVVKINFRGSTGFGKQFEEAGYGEWGRKIQDDIADAARYVIDSGIADPERVCIFGASFGGYSAFQSAIRFPDIYKCAIGYAGVYDLPLLFNDGDIKYEVGGCIFT